MINYNTVLFVIWLFTVLSTRGFILNDMPLDIDCFVMWVSRWFGNESQDKVSAPAHWQIFCEWNSLDRHTHQRSTEANNLCEKKLLIFLSYFQKCAPKRVAWKKTIFFVPALNNCKTNLLNVFGTHSLTHAKNVDPIKRCNLQTKYTTCTVTSIH